MVYEEQLLGVGGGDEKVCKTICCEARAEGRVPLGTKDASEDPKADEQRKERKKNRCRAKARKEERNDGRN